MREGERGKGREREGWERERERERERGRERGEREGKRPRKNHTFAYTSGCKK